MSNILNHNRLTFEFNVSKSDYWDTHLYQSQGGGAVSGLQEDCLAAYIDTTLPDCIISDDEMASNECYYWDKAVNNGVTLNNIGLTGVDNGLIKYDKGSITVEQFMDLYTNSKLEIDEGDLRLHVNKVNGNNKIYSYPNNFVKEDGMNVAKLNGGFFQGFFKTDNDCNYQVLPTELEDGWMVEFTLKPEDFKSNYHITKEKYSVEEYNSDGWDGDLNMKKSEYSDGYINDDYTEDNPLPTLNDVYPNNKGIFFYMGVRGENKWWRYYVDTEDNTEIETADGVSINEQIETIETDNKFITYNRTPDGLKAFMYDRKDESRILQMHKNLLTDNYFIIMHRGKGGYTARTIKELQQESGADYNILADLYRNALAFQIKEDGSVGYKYMVKDCDSETGYSISEEWSNPGLIKMDKWTTIDVRFVPAVKYSSEMYGYTRSLDYMRLMFYVNGKLVLYSKEIPVLDLRLLNDAYSKQEGVPYNISLGGGTQGLADVIYEDFDNIPEYVLFLEKEFGGSFNGYFKSFKFYTCNQHFDNIQENVKYEQSLLSNYLYRNIEIKN